MKASELISSYESKRDEAMDYVRDVADHFHENIGEFTPRAEVRQYILDNFDVSDSSVAEEIISQLVSDLVDPIQQIDGHIGIIDYEEKEFYYRYIRYDDTKGKQKMAVCNLCVDEFIYDDEVSYAKEGEGSLPVEASWTAIDNLMQAHLRREHRETYHELHPPSEPESDEFETGATLLSGTTVGGNTSFHSGNHASSDDHHDYPVPNTGLVNDSVTVAGNSVSLGGSTSINHGHLSNISSDDHHTRYADSEAISAADSQVTDAATSLSGLDTSVNSHHGNTTNPHNVTNSQVGVTSSSTSDGYEITIDGDTYTFIEED